MGIKNKSYILQDLCAIRDQPAHLIHGTPMMTNRFSYITKRLIDFNIPFQIDRFNNNLGQTFFNGYVFLNNFDENKDSLILMAHHDVVNSEFDNFNDNSASLFLLILFSKMFNNVSNIDFNLIVVFTDAEERSFWGAERLYNQIEEGIFAKTNIIHIINLELCGVGNSMWVEDHDSNDLVLNIALDNYDGNFVGEMRTPSSDATFLRYKGVDNITTIGLLNSSDGEFDTSPWSLVHTEKDRYENGDFDDMKNLFHFLESLVIDVNDLYTKKECYVS